MRNNQEIVDQLREISDSTYGLSMHISQVRKIAGLAADCIEKLTVKERAIKAAVEALEGE